MYPGKYFSLHYWKKSNIFIKNIKFSPLTPQLFEIDSVLLAFFQYLLLKYFAKQLTKIYQKRGEEDIIRNTIFFSINVDLKITCSLQKRSNKCAFNLRLSVQIILRSST